MTAAEERRLAWLREAVRQGDWSAWSGRDLMLIDMSFVLRLYDDALAKPAAADSGPA